MEEHCAHPGIIGNYKSDWFHLSHYLHYYTVPHVDPAPLNVKGIFPHYLFGHFRGPIGDRTLTFNVLVTCLGMGVNCCCLSCLQLSKVLPGRNGVLSPPLWTPQKWDDGLKFNDRWLKKERVDIYQSVPRWDHLSSPKCCPGWQDTSLRWMRAVEFIWNQSLTLSLPSK